MLGILGVLVVLAGLLMWKGERVFCDDRQGLPMTRGPIYHVTRVGPVLPSLLDVLRKEDLGEGRGWGWQ